MEEWQAYVEVVDGWIVGTGSLSGKTVRAVFNWRRRSFRSAMLRTGSLEVVTFDVPLGVGARAGPLENAPRDPDDAAVLADLNPELHILPFGIPAGVLGEGEEHRRLPALVGLLRDVL